MIGLAVILVVGGTAITCMIQINRQAQIHRLYTYAAVAVQNQIQLVLTDTPYIPQQSSQYPIPSELTTGATSTSITICSDPLVTGTMTSTVSTANSSLNVAQILVTLTYTYRNKSYSVTENTMRASDI
jgi:hypothetical protein